MCVLSDAGTGDDERSRWRWAMDDRLDVAGLEFGLARARGIEVEWSAWVRMVIVELIF